MTPKNRRLFRQHLKNVARHRQPLEVSLSQTQTKTAAPDQEDTTELIAAYDQLAAIYEVAQMITAPLQLEVVLDTIVRNTVEFLGTDTAVILLLDEMGETLSIQAAHGLSAAVMQGTHDHVGESLAGRVVQQGQPIIANDLPNDPRFYNPSAANEGLLACASVPLRRGTNIIGTLDVHSKTNRWAFNETHIRILEMLASQAAIAIENARLYAKLQKSRAELELRVQERTAELVAANDRLQHEIAERNRAEEQLAEERNLLRTIIDILPDPIYVKDMETRFINANTTIVRIMGAQSLDKLVGKTDFDFYPPELAAQYYADDQAVIKSGQPLINREEPNIQQPSGSQKWILTTKTPFRDHQGNIIGLVGIGRDITDRKRSEAVLRQHNRELATLNNMGEALQTRRTEAETYKVVLDVCEQLFPRDSGCLYLAEPSSSTLKLGAFWGNPPPHAHLASVEDCWALQYGQTYITRSPNMISFCPYLQSFAGNFCLCVPISVPGQRIGVLHLRLEPRQPGYSEQEWDYLVESKYMLAIRIAEQYALFLSNLRLRETLKSEAIRDPLTGLYNRRHMEASLEREARRIERRPARLGIIMLDIDHFKRFNDRYGHDAGDLALREMGTILLNHVRGEDIACRYGGEEFLVIMSEASVETTRKRAEELCLRARNLRLMYQHELLSFTISIGVATLPEHGADVKVVVKAADLALYQAKAAGRDRVVVAAAADKSVGSSGAEPTTRIRRLRFA